MKITKRSKFLLIASSIAIPLSIAPVIVSCSNQKSNNENKVSNENEMVKSPLKEELKKEMSLADLKLINLGLDEQSAAIIQKAYRNAQVIYLKDNATDQEILEQTNNLKTSVRKAEENHYKFLKELYTLRRQIDIIESAMAEIDSQSQLYAKLSAAVNKARNVSYNLPNIETLSEENKELQELIKSLNESQNN